MHVTSIAVPCGSPSRAITLALCLLALLAGCATPGSLPGPGSTAGGSEPASGSPGARPANAPPSPVVSEQRWLEEWFKGTPVQITLADMNTLAVDVPLANSFDAGKTIVKPALAAVLERVATSLRRQPAMRLSIATPPDAARANAALASARALQVRDFLVARGIPTTRMSGVGTASAGAAVQLRLVTTPQAIGRLDDGALPPPAAGVRTAPAAPVPAPKR